MVAVLVSDSMSLIIQIPYVSVIIHCLSFWYWLISLSMMLSRYIHVIANCRITFFLNLNNILLYYMTIFLSPFIYLWNLYCSYNLWIMLGCTWEGGYLFEIIILIILAIYLEVRLLDHSVVLLIIFLWNIHTIFRSGCVILYPWWQCRRVPNSSHSHQQLLSFLIFFIFLSSLMWIISLWLCFAFLNSFLFWYWVVWIFVYLSY